MEAPDFRTFCHISEYGPDGYRNLHRMVATSSPLVLWAPSSTLLSSPDCRISPKDFIEYVHDGQIRIVAREPWLMSPDFRNNHPWTDGARWVKPVDDEVLRIAERDKTKPIAEQRVIVAPHERGKEWAEDYAEKNPRAIERVQRAMRSKDSARKIPAGVLDTAMRYSSDARGAAIQVLRQAYNHGDAISLAKATVPFFLANQDCQFVQWIGNLDNDSPPAVERARAKLQQDYSQLARQLLELLRTMELVGGVDNLRGFMASDGHSELVRWYGRICQVLAEESPRSVDHKLYRELIRSLDDAVLENTFRSWMANKFDAGTFSVGWTTGVAGLAADGPTSLAIAGVLAGTLPIGTGILKRLGYVSAKYTGPQWPFLYTFGRKASGRRVNRLRKALRIATQT